MNYMEFLLTFGMLLVVFNIIQLGFYYFLKIKVKYMGQTDVILVGIINMCIILIAFLFAWDVSVLRNT